RRRALVSFGRGRLRARLWLAARRRVHARRLAADARGLRARKLPARLPHRAPHGFGRGRRAQARTGGVYGRGAGVEGGGALRGLAVAAGVAAVLGARGEGTALRLEERATARHRADGRGADDSLADGPSGRRVAAHV